MTSIEPLKNIVQELSKIPGIGHKTAQRMALYLLSIKASELDYLIEAIKDLKDNVGFCKRCFYLSYKTDLCTHCSDEHRDKNKLCLVSDSKDVLAIEKMGRYNGIYHVLGGVISPLDGIGPEQLRIKEFLQRLKTEEIKEIIFALTPSIEGETTTMYLTKLLKPLNIQLSQIAHGIPLGSDLEWADELTLNRAFEGRNIL
ncbi:MAG: recombination mediator RecR [Candidatus Margulisbacteria bacterium]|nr:recombination mediator RecR [Candidatus Margulisiibacteriota bacterium]